VTYKTPTGGLDLFQILPPNTASRPLPPSPVSGDFGAAAVNITTDSPSDASIVAVLDIENDAGLVSMEGRRSATDFAFPHVANGNGLFTGLALATGASAANVTVDVYPAAGGLPKSATISVGANQQVAKLISEIVGGVATQLGGYIRVRSSQPIWAWEIYGSGQIMASGPPL
jgi:hypothetical protein